jgi:hypothetical protein
MSGGLVFSDIQLQPHQKVPVQYLTQHPEQKGLLLFHSLGSGKTYIALDYTEKNSDKKVIILLPEFLKSNWITQMKSFGVKNSARYELVSLQESEKILKYDLSNTIVIVDEVHKLVQKMRLNLGQSSEGLIAVYEKLKTAKNILMLTGTPIFVDISDIAYIANLLVDGDPYPIDPIKFRTEFMRVKPGTSLVRGHVTESKLMFVGVPFFVTLASVVTLGTALPWAVPLVALVGSSVIPITNEVFPVNQVSFREFDAEKWKDFAEKYVSYYHVKLVENENYPKKNMIERKILYNDFQASFFLSFIDEDLSAAQLKIMLSDENSACTESYLKFHSLQLQKELLSHATAGREIGNLEHISSKGEIVEAPKFLNILNELKNKPGQVVVYSNYFRNGIQRFADFLDRHGMKADYLILSPQQSVTAQMEVVDQYNKAKKRILLIHPDITEGISLVGTEQFHLLEPINNTALLEQIVGRSIRYLSHAHLPKDRRTVHVYLWETDVEYSKLGIPTSAGLLRREHWQKNYSEVSPSMWTKGILELDSNYYLKDETPDRRVKRHKTMIQNDIESFRDLLNSHSIEKSMKLEN